MPRLHLSAFFRSGGRGLPLGLSPIKVAIVVRLRQAVSGDGDAQITLIALRRRLCGTHRLLHGGQHAPALTEEHLDRPRSVASGARCGRTTPRAICRPAPRMKTTTSPTFLSSSRASSSPSSVALPSTPMMRSPGTMPLRRDSTPARPGQLRCRTRGDTQHEHAFASSQGQQALIELFVHLMPAPDGCACRS